MHPPEWWNERVARVVALRAAGLNPADDPSLAEFWPALELLSRQEARHYSVVDTDEIVGLVREKLFLAGTLFEQFDPSREFEAYFKRIVQYTAIDENRRSKRQSKVVDSGIDLQGVQDRLRSPECPVDPDLKRTLDCAIDTLLEKEQRLATGYGSGMTQKELGEQNGITEGGAGKRLWKIWKKLRVEMGLPPERPRRGKSDGGHRKDPPSRERRVDDRGETDTGSNAGGKPSADGKSPHVRKQKLHRTAQTDRNTETDRKSEADPKSTPGRNRGDDGKSGDDGRGARWTT